eukprot:3241269-Rhodomonas_salina.1
MLRVADAYNGGGCLAGRGGDGRAGGAGPRAEATCARPRVPRHYGHRYAGTPADTPIGGTTPRE